MRRVLLFNNTPAPYLVPLFEELRRKSGWHLTLCFASRWNADTGWRKGEVEAGLSEGQTVHLDELPVPGRRWLGETVSIILGVLGVLGRERPDYLVIYGYTLIPQVTLLIWAMLRRRPFAVLGDANIHADRAGGVRRWLKRLWLGWIVRRAAVIPTIGKANRQFWLSYGARADDLAAVPFSVDNASLAKGAARAKEEAARERARLGLSRAVIFLSVGRLIARKNLATLIRAFRSVEGVEMGLIIVGTGEERPELERLATGDPRIHFTGGVAPVDLPRWYALSDVLVLISRDEPWGLVVNEAMACGLAILAHQHCGATPDLVDDENGIVLEGFGEQEVAEALRRLATVTPAHLRQMQERSQEKIADWGIEATAKGLIEAVERTPFEESNTPNGRKEA
ncbi:MAG: glycosyltransferase family 4 protein [Blastocatellia bacterium]